MGEHLVRWVATASGLIATAAATLVLAAVAAEPPAAADEPAAAGPQPAEPVVLVDPSASMPTEPIAGIDAAVSGALVSGGYTEMLTTSELQEQLPASVVSALELAGAVLVMPNEEATDGR